MAKQELSKEQRKRLKEYYKKVLEAQERYESERRELKIKKQMDWEKDQFFYGR